MQISFSGASGSRRFSYGGLHFVVKPTMTEARKWNYQLRVQTKEAVRHVLGKNAMRIYENSSGELYRSNLFNYIITGTAVEIIRADYPLGEKYENYADCIKAAKVLISQMIDTVSQKVEAN